MAEQKTREGREITRHQGGFTVPEGVVPPPLFSDQNFFLYNIAHERQIPTSSKPAIRLLGAFETEAEAREMVPETPTASYFVSPTHKFIPLLSSMDASLEATVTEISELHGQLIIANDKDFEDMIDNQRQGVSGKSVRSIRKQSERTRITRELDTAHMKSCPQLTADRCVAGQNVAVITMLQDIRPASLRGEQPLEPLVAVLHVASTLEDASNYAKYTATKHYPRNVMFVVDMYKWLYPEHVDLDEIANVESSNEMVTEIAQKNRSKKSKIQEMKSQHPECVIEVDGKPREDVDALSLNPEAGQEMTRLP